MERIIKDVKHYLNLSYPVQLTKTSEDGEEYWLAEILDLPGCVSHGSSPEEAIENIEEAKQLWIETQLEDGQGVPEPTDTRGFSGKLLLRMPKTLHRRLAYTAQREGVSLNQHLVSSLARTSHTDERIQQLEGIVDKLSRQVLGANTISKLIAKLAIVLEHGTGLPREIDENAPALERTGTGTALGVRESIFEIQSGSTGRILELLTRRTVESIREPNLIQIDTRD